MVPTAAGPLAGPPRTPANPTHPILHPRAAPLPLPNHTDGPSSLSQCRCRLRKHPPPLDHRGDDQAIAGVVTATGQDLPGPRLDGRRDPGAPAPFPAAGSLARPAPPARRAALQLVGLEPGWGMGVAPYTFFCARCHTHTHPPRHASDGNAGCDARGRWAPACGAGQPDPGLGTDPGDTRGGYAAPVPGGAASPARIAVDPVPLPLPNHTDGPSSLSQRHQRTIVVVRLEVSPRLEAERTLPATALLTGGHDLCVRQEPRSVPP
jgi:hypothetical protein